MVATELVKEKLVDLVINATGSCINKKESVMKWKQLLVNTGKFFCEHEKKADQIFDDLAAALSEQNTAKLATELASDSGYEVEEKLYNYLVSLLRAYEIPEDIVLAYASGFTGAIIDNIRVMFPEKYDRYFLNDWRKKENAYFQQSIEKLEKISTALASIQQHRIKVYSANDFDLALKRKTRNPRIGIDFFEIDDDDFKAAFAEKIHENKVCVRGRFIEETIYCILNELWRIRDARPAFIVQSEDDWENLRNIQEKGNIYIPNFYADEITPIENNTNIFIYTDDIPAFSNEIIDLRPRTYATIAKCLVRAGMGSNEADEFVAETHGLYVAMKKKLFNGQILKMPKWVSELDNRVKNTCLLMGQWTECDGDIAVVENLSGMKYADFIDQLMPFAKGEDPLIYIFTRRGSKSYYLASVENTWEYEQISVSDAIWKTFVEVFFEVLNEHEKMFTYAPEEKIRAQYAGETLFWSATIRKGMLRTLLIKAGYKQHEECQACLDEIVENIMSHIDTPEKWKYISEFFIELCEISPRVILKRLFAELENSTGLMDLFEHQDPDFLMGKNYYYRILFGVEEFLLQREFATEAYIWLLKLDDKNFEYTSNSPEDEFKKVLCTWRNYSVFCTSTEKIRLAELAFEHSKNAWEIVYKNLPDSHESIAGTLCAPKYRKCVEESDTTYDELNKSVAGYINLLIKHAEFMPERWIKLIKYSDDVDQDTRTKIIDSFLFESIQMNDFEKISVKDSIRRLIYNQRFFASASWAMSEEDVLVYEQLLDKIQVSKPEYEYLYLFKPENESPLLHPVPYKVEDRRDLNKEAEEKLLEAEVAEFKEKNYDLLLLAELCASFENSSLGHALSKNWDGEKFDSQVFITLVEAQKSGKMAIDYYRGFSSQASDLFDTVMKIATAHGAEIDFITKIYQVEAASAVALPKIAEAEEKVKTQFWKDAFISVNYDVTWCIEECRQYGTLNSYMYFLYVAYNDKKITTEELYQYFDEIDNMKPNEREGELQYYIKELLEPLQKAYIYDSTKCIRLARIEILFFSFLEWNNMKCFMMAINKDPDLLAELIKKVFKKDHEENCEQKEAEKINISILYRLFHKIEFCPTEREGVIKKDDLKAWIEQFRKLLKANDQSSLFGMVVGRLFAFSPVGDDGHRPCEAVRNMIEKYADQSLQREYAATIFNRRGVHSPTAGKAEKKIALVFTDNAEYLAASGYPKTAEIYYSLARTYNSESTREREEAENGRF